MSSPVQQIRQAASPTVMPAQGSPFDPHDADGCAGPRRNLTSIPARGEWIRPALETGATACGCTRRHPAG